MLGTGSEAGPQHPPIPGVHNSGWVQSRMRRLMDPGYEPQLKAYVQDVVGAFARETRADVGHVE